MGTLIKNNPHWSLECHWVNLGAETQNSEA